MLGDRDQAQALGTVHGPGPAQVPVRSAPHLTSGVWGAITGAALVLYLALATATALERPGLEYDEALMVHGAVQMRHVPGEPTFAHDQGSWVHVLGRWWPLMVIPYVGAAKHYLMLAPFALFGSRVLLVRVVSALLAALGVWGVAKLLRQEVSPPAGAAAALLLAVNPSYIAQTVFDNSGASLWMASLGLVCLASARYVRRPGIAEAFLVGLAAGFGVWARLNFTWLLASVAVVALLVAGKAALPPLRHAVASLGGFGLGAAPVIVYELLSRLATLRFMSQFALEQPLASLVPHRLHDLLEVLLSDGERRTMWDGPPVPGWQLLLLTATVVLALASALWPERGEPRRARTWTRGSALALLLYTVLLLTSRMRVLQHHLVTVLPLIAAAVVSGACVAARRVPVVRFVAVAAGVAYMVLALHWDAASIGGLARTGGMRTWSDGIGRVTRYLEDRCPGQRVNLLDWGFANNMFVISDGTVRASELFWGSTDAGTGFAVPWSQVVEQGGLFVACSKPPGSSRYEWPSNPGFRAALAASHARYTRTPFFDRLGHPFAEVFEVEPAAKAATTQ